MCIRDRYCDDGARAIDDVGWRRRCASYGVIDNRSENLQHSQWGRLLSLAQRCGGAALNDHKKLAALTALAALTRARGERRFQRAVRPSCAEQTDRLEPAVRLWSTSPFLFSVLRRWSSGCLLYTSPSPR